MSETVGQMKTRHKLELRNFEKDYRAKIKAAKGKEKKRGLKEEQKKAEKEMKERHQKELNGHSSEETKATDVEAELAKVDINPKQKQPVERKLSKAQRRRLRQKAREEEERKKHEAETAKMTDYKKIELDRMAVKLAPLGFRVHAVEADGNCLFRACDHQLKISGGNEDLKLDEPAHESLRKLAAECLKKHGQDYRPYLLKDDGSLMSEEDYEKYCDKMGSTSAWGGQAEIAALCKTLNRQIVVHSAFANDITMGVPNNDLEPLRIAYHKHYYALGAHYNSVVKIEKQ